VNAWRLLRNLRGRGFKLREEDGRLVVDGPAGDFTEELEAILVELKPRLLELLRRESEQERRRLEHADRRGLVIRWSREPGWISLHDPTTGEWHEVEASGCLPGVVESARRNRGKRASRAPPG